jgi:hypothetical protein
VNHGGCWVSCHGNIVYSFDRYICNCINCTNSVNLFRQRMLFLSFVFLRGRYFTALLAVTPLLATDPIVWLWTVVVQLSGCARKRRDARYHCWWTWIIFGINICCANFQHQLISISACSTWIIMFSCNWRGVLVLFEALYFCANWVAPLRETNGE